MENNAANQKARTLGELLRIRKKTMNLTEEALAGKAYRSERQIRNILQDKSIPKLDTLLYLFAGLVELDLGDLNVLLETLKEPTNF